MSYMFTIFWKLDLNQEKKKNLKIDLNPENKLNPNNIKYTGINPSMDYMLSSRYSSKFLYSEVFGGLTQMIFRLLIKINELVSQMTLIFFWLTSELAFSFPHSPQPTHQRSYKFQVRITSQWCAPKVTERKGIFLPLVESVSKADG